MTETKKKPKQQVTSESSADLMYETFSSSNVDNKVLNQEQLKIMDWLKEVQFQKQLIGGINEQDVWKKIQQLNELYEAALKAERIRYDALLKKQSLESNSTTLLDVLKKGN